MTRASRGVRGRGFTLIELLVVVAVISILISILLPAVGRARAAAWQIGGSSTQRQLFIGMQTYSASNDGWYPGVNTSGWFIARAAGMIGDSDPIVQKLSTSPSLPVQSFDWMSPGLDEGAVPSERNARFYNLLGVYACPAMRERSPVYTVDVDAGATAMQEHLARNGLQAARGVSFLMPMSFQLISGSGSVGRGPPSSRRQIFIDQIQGSYGLSRGQAVIPGTPISGISGDTPAGTYRPRADLIKNSAKKIAIADGFRYAIGTVVDFDASYKPGIFGSFTSSSPVFANDTAWGGQGSPSAGRNLLLSYRHGNRMNALLWDGHGEPISREQSFDPTFWFPSGSMFMGGSGTAADSFKFYDARDIIN